MTRLVLAERPLFLGGAPTDVEGFQEPGIVVPPSLDGLPRRGEQVSSLRMVPLQGSSTSTGGEAHAVAVERRAKDQRPFGQTFEERAGVHGPGRFKTCQGASAVRSAKSRRIPLASLGVDHDHHVQNFRCGVPRDQVEAIETDEGALDRVRQGLRGGHTDSESRERPGAEANGDEIEIRGSEFRLGHQRLERGNQDPAVPDSGIRIAYEDSSIRPLNRGHASKRRSIKGHDVQ